MCPWWECGFGTGVVYYGAPVAFMLLTGVVGIILMSGLWRR